jgi:hypothetical protein
MAPLLTFSLQEISQRVQSTFEDESSRNPWRPLKTPHRHLHSPILLKHTQTTPSPTQTDSPASSQYFASGKSAASSPDAADGPQPPRPLEDEHKRRATIRLDRKPQLGHHVQEALPRDGAADCVGVCQEELADDHKEPLWEDVDVRWFGG